MTQINAAQSYVDTSKGETVADSEARHLIHIINKALSSGIDENSPAEYTYSTGSRTMAA